MARSKGETPAERANPAARWMNEEESRDEGVQRSFSLFNVRTDLSFACNGWMRAGWVQIRSDIRFTAHAKEPCFFFPSLPFFDCGLGFFFVPFCFFSSTLACLLAGSALSGASSPESSLLGWDGSFALSVVCCLASVFQPIQDKTAAALFLFEPAVGRASGFAGRGRFFSFSPSLSSSSAVLCFVFPQQFLCLWRMDTREGGLQERQTRGRQSGNSSRRAVVMTWSSAEAD